MSLDPHRILNWPFEERVQTYTARDTMLYALSVGLGADPVSLQQLRFVTERNLAALPTMAMILGWPGLWFADRATGIDATTVVNGGQGLVLHERIPAEATVRSQTRVTGLIDKGAGRGALIYLERTIVDHASGRRLATVSTTLFCRNDGGFGGSGGLVQAEPRVPDREPDLTVDLPSLPQSHLLYRLNGDHHPLHVDPEFARSVGFPGPILHGLCTFGMAGHALLQAVCGYEPRGLTSLRARFSAPVFPGETLTVGIWREDAAVSYRAWVRARNSIVLDNGHATIGNHRASPGEELAKR
jgi:acyl dehydratase